MQKWIYALLALWLVGCSTDGDDGLTDDERRSKEIWSVVTSSDGLWATYTPVPEDFTVFSDSVLVQEFLDLNGLSPTLTVRDVARPEKGGTRFKSIRIDLSAITKVRDTLTLPDSWSQLSITQLYIYGGAIKSVSGLKHLGTVRDLAITGTEITVIPDEILDFDLLWLSLFSNAILELPEWVVDYVDTNQIILWVNNNQIQEMPANLLQKHWQIRVSGNHICNVSAEDSLTIFELSKSGTGGYKQPNEYLSDPALGFYPQDCSQEGK
jgi:hypothetical protein